MGYVTKEMSARAREVTVLDYVVQYENHLFKQIGSSYRLREHPSLAVSAEGFFWHSKGREFSGVTALDYLIKIRNYDFVSAVCHLIGESPIEKGESSKVDVTNKEFTKTKQSVLTEVANKKTVSYEKVSYSEQSNQKSLMLPRRNKNNYNVISYLQNRGIDKQLIKDCINQGVIYESAVYHNAVFLGKDENGKTKYASIRGTIGDFKRDVEGSNKSYGLVITPENSISNIVVICESPIDCLSHKTLCNKGFLPNTDTWRISLGGTSLLSFTHFLAQHPEIEHCNIATDNDEAGNAVAQNIKKELEERNAEVRDGFFKGNKLPITVECSSPLVGYKDFNEMLITMLKTVRTKNKSIQMDR